MPRLIVVILALALVGASFAPAIGRGWPGAPTASVLAEFDAEIEAALPAFDLVGAAVAVVHEGNIVYSRGFGVRDVGSRAPVTTATLFRVASTTKSMTSLLTSILADDGVLSWDQPVIDVWRDFRAPTPALTRSLRVRDMMGMASGLTEIGGPDFAEFYAVDQTAPGALQDIASMPVTWPPDAVFEYNNTLFGAGGYLGLLAQGTPPQGLVAAYTEVTRRRVFDPIGMTTAAIAPDPRPLSADYATPYTRNALGGVAAMPFNDISGVAPSGMAIASVIDMARYVITQMNRGVTPGGARIVSEANLLETWRPHISIKFGSVTQPDTAALGYALGWIVETFRDGRRMVWHNGSIDGSATLIGFFPNERVGFVAITNMQFERGGELFNIAVQNALISRLFGYDRGVNALIASEYAKRAQALAALGASTSPADAATVAPWLGSYERGWRVEMVAGVLRIVQGVRTMQLRALPDGRYLVIDGWMMSLRVQFARDADSTLTMAVEGFAPVRYLR